MNPDTVRQQITNLELLYPELAEDREAWALTIESETDLPELMRQIERRRREAAHMAGAIEETMIELGDRQKRFERREAAMRELAFKLMQAADMRKLEMPEATYSVRNGQQKLVGDADPETFPDWLCRIKRELDKAKIKEELKAGKTVAGFELSNAEPSLSIRVK